MIFSSRELRDPHKQLSVLGTPLEQVQNFNYLGVVLDQHLTFDGHAKNIIRRVSSKVYQLRRLKKFLSNKAALLVYKNMILPIMEYGDIYLISASAENMRKLQVLQNRALKCALDKEKRYSTLKLHKEAKIFKLKHRRKLHLIQHMYKFSQLPNFSGWKGRPSIRTRSSKKKLMKIKTPTVTKFQNSMSYRGPKSWNSLPKEIQKEPTFMQFKDRLKCHFTNL